MDKKKMLALYALSLMTVGNVQNTDEDLEWVAEHVFNHTYAKDFDYEEISVMLSDLWTFYTTHLHDGYNVTVPRKEVDNG